MHTHTAIPCRKGCGACCIAPSISSPIPGMPNGKPAGVRCIHLSPDHCCGLWQQPGRPAVCNSLPAMLDTCGNNFGDAMDLLTKMETATAPIFIAARTVVARK